ncbi:MAG: recombinase family protein [Lachnospiraceae bacterium]|nr:recombinase family protein [Lachnospiraceae bacterium]
MRVGLYVRVSSEEQKKYGWSVDTQITDLKDYCSANDYDIVDIYNDAGISARKRYTKRPELLRMLDDCRAGKLQMVLFTKMDRFFRSVRDYYECLSVLESSKVSWKAIYENHDLSIPAGTFNLNIVLSVSQFEADQTGERIRTVNEYRRAKGEWLSSAPTGYRVEKSHLYIDESKREAVRAGFEAYMNTRSVTDMHDAMTAHGLVIGRQTCFRMLNNPVYTGFSHNHHCEPYLTQEEWDFIQRGRNTGAITRTARGEKVYLFQGLIFCAECGAMYRAQTRTMYTRSKERRKNYHQFYECGHGKEHTCVNRRTIGEKVIERQLLAMIEQAMDEYQSSVENVQESDGIDYEAEKAKIERQIRRVGDRYELEEITREEYMSKVKELRSKLDALTPAPVREIKKLPEGWKDLYNSLDPSHRKSFWLNTIHKIIIDKDANIKIQF